MKMFPALAFHAFMLLFISTVIHSQNCSNPMGEWRNQNGSVLTIDSITQSGLIIGKYRSHEGTEGQAFPVTGWWSIQDTIKQKTAVSVTVYWKPYQTITSWTGYCQSDENSIHTLWHHIDTDTRFDFQEWSTQASVFKAMSP